MLAERRALSVIVKRIATFLALASITALLLGMLGRYFWPLDLLAHFRVHYVVALLVCAALLLAARDFRAAAFAVLAGGLAAAPVVQYLGAGEDEPAAGPTLKVLSLNIWFRRDDPLRLVSYLEASGADIIVLQEISREEAQQLGAALKSYPHAFIDGAAASDSVLFSKWPIRHASAVELASDAVSALLAGIEWHGRRIDVVAAHLHWPLGARTATRRDAELAGLAELARTNSNPLIVLGDFNVTPWSPHFTQLLETSRLRDCALGHGLDPTWPSPVQVLGIRIDHCLASLHWQTIDTHVGPHVGSDHRPMIAVLRLREFD